jgi:hypothetical protein
VEEEKKETKPVIEKVKKVAVKKVVAKKTTAKTERAAQRAEHAQEIKLEKQEANYYLAMQIAKVIENSQDYDFSYTAASVNKAIALAKAILKAHLAIKSRA